MTSPVLFSFGLLVLASSTAPAVTLVKATATPPMELSQPAVPADVPLRKTAEFRLLEPRFAPAAVAHGHFIYIIGGSGAHDRPLASVERFDVRTGRSKPFATLQTARLWHQAVLVGDKIYVLGGDSLAITPAPTQADAVPSASWAMPTTADPATRFTAERITGDRMARERTELGPGKQRGFSSTAVLPDNLPPASTLGGRQALASVEIIDLATGATAAGPAMPEPRTNFACATIGNRIFAIGGRAFSAAGPIVSNRVFVLDTATDKWSEVAPIPHVRSDAAAAVVSGDFVLVAGGYRRPAALATVEVLNPRTGTWSEIAPLSRPCSAHSLVFLGHQLFLFGDYDNPGELIAYDLNTKTSAALTLPYKAARHTAAVVANDEIFVIGGRTDRHQPPTDLIQVFAPVSG